MEVYSPQVLALGWEVLEKAAESLDREGKTKVAFKNARNSAFKAAAGVFMGSFLLGPVGMLVGGAIGVGLAYSTSEEYEGFLSVVAHMTPQEQAELLDRFLSVASREALRADNLLRLLLQLKEESPQKAASFLESALKGFASGHKRKTDTPEEWQQSPVITEI